jgi:hypothetical protein
LEVILDKLFPFTTEVWQIPCIDYVISPPSYLHEKSAVPSPNQMAADYSNVKVYTVNGATAGSSSSLPDWLTRKRAASAKGKRAVREQVEGSLELIQGFEFPEASNRIRTTRDGHHAIATGTYKPQMRVWDLDQLTLKFERHSDAENVDFVVRELFPNVYRLLQLCPDI